MCEPVISDNAEAQRFELRVGEEVAGFAEYRDDGNRRMFTHTVVEPAYEGQGLASSLIRGVLDDARRHGLEVLPRCTFVRGYIDRHRDDYLDLVPEPVRARYQLG